MSNLEQVPGPLFTYKDQQSFGVNAGKTQVEISPKYGGDPFKTGDIIRLEIPSQAYLDPSEFFIQMRARIFPGTDSTITNLAANGILNPVEIGTSHLQTLTATGKTDYRHVKFVPGIQCCFDRVKLVCGSTVIEDIQDYNVLYRMWMEGTTTPSWQQTDGRTNEGFYDVNEPAQVLSAINAHTAKNVSQENTGHYYTFRPLLGLFMAGKAIPLKYMGQLTIELYLADSKDCLWSSCSVNGYNTDDVSGNKMLGARSATVPRISTPTADAEHFAIFPSAGFKVDFPNAYYTIDRVRMQIPFLHPIEDYDKEMLDTIEKEGLQIYFNTFSSHTRQITAPGTVQLSFQERALFLKGGLACMRNSQGIRNIASDLHFAANAIESYQWKIGSEYVPAQEILCNEGAGMALSQLTKALGGFSAYDGTHNIEEEDFLPHDYIGENETQNRDELLRGVSQPSKFMMALNLDKSPGQISGFDSAAAGVDVELHLRLKEYNKVNPRTDAAAKFQGSTFSTWQPMKVKITTGTPVQIGSMSSDSGMVYSSAVDWTSPKTLHGVPGGIMHNPDIVTTYTQNAGNLSTLTLAVNPAYTAVYSRVHFFAHIDAVLRIRRVGQIETVR